MIAAGHVEEEERIPDMLNQKTEQEERNRE